MRGFLACLSAFAIVCAARPAAAPSAPGIAYGLTDDAWLANGPGTVEDRVATLDGLGVQVVRFTVRWDAVAPTEPATPTDPQTPPTTGRRRRASSARFMPAGSTSSSNSSVHRRGRTEASRRTTSRRAPKSFAAFATAVAHEYPWVKKLQIWNEPNQARWLRPTSAPLYVTRLLNPAYAALHAATTGVKVAAAAPPRAARPEACPRSPGSPPCIAPARASTRTRTTPIRSTRSGRRRCTRPRARRARRSRWRR